MAVTFTTDTARSQDADTMVGCPGLTAHITFNDYDGAHLVQMCVAPNGFSITGGAVNLRVYDNLADGVFHNGFEALR